MVSIEQALKSAKQQLIEANLLDTPLLDAELLMAECLNKDRTYLFTWGDRALDNEQMACFKKSLTLRLEGRPIAHILGYREFWGLKLKVTADTLIPRPDTETLIETVLSLTLPHAPSILDMGTGSGAIALALKSELPESTITGLDKSNAALKVAQENALQLRLNIDFLRSDWFSSIPDNKFDCIVSNPPYIEEQDPHLKLGDVRFEPISALTSGQDGLDDISLIVDKAWHHLNPNGWLVIEHGYNQSVVVSELLARKGYHKIQVARDLGDNPRVSLAQKPA